MEILKISLLVFAVVFQCQALNLGSDLPTSSSVVQHLLQSTQTSSPASGGVSKECEQRLRNMSIDEQFRYLDSSGKPESGIFSGNVKWLGSFDQCLDTPKSRYCLVDLEGKFKTNTSHRISVGICIPDGCDKNDVTNGVENMLQKTLNRYFPGVRISSYVSHTGIQCYEDPSYSSGVVFTIIICALLLAFSIIGTAMEMIQETYASNTSVQIDVGCSEITEHEILKLAQANEKTPLLKDTNGRNGFTESVRLKLAEEREKEETLKPNIKLDELQPINSIVVDFFLCFSLLGNSRRLLNTDSKGSNVASLNGIRVISMFWVILGHVYTWAFTSRVLDNDIDYFYQTKTFSMMIVINAPFSVDTFFFISGLLVAYNVFMVLKKSDGGINWGWFVLHRYLRLTPAFAFVILFVVNLLPFIDKSPLWSVLVDTTEHCKDYWWTNLLYINNFYPTNPAAESCFVWSWYLALIMQFFLLSPIIIYVFRRYRYKGVIATSVFLLLVCTITTAAIIDHYDIHPMAMATSNLGTGAMDLFNYVYDKPYCRIQPYLIGLVFGYLMHTKSFRAKVIGWPLAIVCWVLAITVSLAVIYAPYTAVRKNPHQWSTFEKILYGSIRHTLWGLVVAWVTYACEYGYGGYVKEFLSAKFWIPLSRLTYCAYLTHYQLLEVMFIGFRSGLHFSHHVMVYIFCGALVLSYVIAFLLAGFVEYSCANIERMILRRMKRHRNT